MENDLRGSVSACHLLIVALLIVSGLLACQKSSTTNSSPNTNASPLPLGISTSPLPPGQTPTPGIPDVNAQKNNNQPSGTPTPGIPDVNSLKKGKTPRLIESTTPSKGPVTQGQTNKKKL